MIKKILGDFELFQDKLIGKGTWGDVYHGRQSSLNRPVAIKVLKKELTSNKEFVKRFRRESEILANINNEYIVQVYSAGESEESYYFVMEYLHGQTLNKFIERNHKFTTTEVVFIAKAVTQALKTAWESPAKIVHRDIKPSNIMVCYPTSAFLPIPDRDEMKKDAELPIDILQGKIKVMDYGLAKFTENISDSTMSGMIVGTPKYISPEQATGQPADIRSDIYSLGLIMYELVTGTLPFKAETAMSVIRRHISEEPLLPSFYKSDILPALQSIIMKCIHKEPGRRYAHPGLLLEDIESFKKNQTPIHAAVSLTETIHLAIKRVKKTKPLYAVGSVILIFLLLVLFIFLKTAESIPPETARLLNRIELLVDEEKSNTAWEEFDKIPAESRELKPVKKIKNNLLNSWTKKIRSILDDEKTDITRAWEEYEKIPSVLRSDAVLSPITQRLNEKWRQTTKIQLTYNFLAGNPAVFPDKFYTTPQQHSFNEIFSLSKSKNYSAAYQQLDTDFIEINDPEVSPSAIYFKMKLLLEENPENQLAQMDDLFKKLNKEYPSSHCIALAEILLNQSPAYQDKIYNNYLSQLADSSLDTQLELLTEFVKSYPGNINISRAEEQIKNIKRLILRRQAAYYKELISGIKEKLDVEEKAGYLQALKDLGLARKIALQIEENQESLNDLEYQIEKGYLALCGIKLEGKNKIGSLYQFIKNIADSSEMILIPVGEFTMGSNEGKDDEKPAQAVNLTDYYIDKYEISNAQFKTFVEAANYKTDAEKSGKGWVWNGTELKEVAGADWRNPDGTGRGIKMNHPVVQVSWNDARAYADWAGKRLPKEAEWEKAARGITMFSYPWGNEWQPNYCNNITANTLTAAPVSDYEKGKSPYGCYNMAGNVAEWCLDWYFGSYDKTSRSLTDETVPVLRGGAFNLPKEQLRSAARQTGYFLKQSHFWASHTGFRCVKDVNTDLQPYLGKK